MMLGGMMFSVVVIVVIFPFVPENSLLLLCHVISQSVVAHIPLFGTFLMDVVVYESIYCGIVCLDGGGRLLMF